ncbi:PPK2 family polyphosphate kinase [Chitinophagaceae bacterium MMS25-I14]
MHKIKLHDIDTRASKSISKSDTKKEFQSILKELDDLQNLLYASGQYSVLVVIQGMDASGKDGLTRDVFTSMNPQGVNVKSYKEPTAEELAHDFLWRIHQNTPGKGMIHVFNRSHYEDVLVTRVHGLIDDKTASKRMHAINNFEDLLAGHNYTQVLKFYLHISPEEQKKRLKERLEVPHKMWKYNANDFKEARLWDKYMKCYEDVFEHCSNIPWHIIPSDQNWYKSYLVAKKLRDVLKSLHMQYPGMKK